MQQKDQQASLDLEYVQLNVPKVLALFNKVSRIRAFTGFVAPLADSGTAVRETEMRLSVKTSFNVSVVE